jgi:hypothetical protein
MARPRPESARVPATVAVDTATGELVVTVQPPGVPAYEWSRVALPFPRPALDKLRAEAGGDGQ